MDVGTAVVVILAIHFLGLPAVVAFLIFHLMKKGMSAAGTLAVSSFTALFLGVIFTLIFTGIAYGGHGGAILLYLCFLAWIVLGITGIGATLAVLWRSFKRSR